MARRQSNNPKRRITKRGTFSNLDLASIRSKVTYVGSALHKRTSGGYGFHPPVNPRQSKSLCDDVKKLNKAKAELLLSSGIGKEMMSTRLNNAGLPKYVWSVDADGYVYEAKSDSTAYHGYRLDPHDEKEMLDLVQREWHLR